MAKEKSSSIKDKTLEDKIDSLDEKIRLMSDLIEEKLAKLEYVIRMTAHYNGTNRVLDECGFERWEPSKKHLKRA